MLLNKTIAYFSSTANYAFSYILLDYVVIKLSTGSSKNMTERQVLYSSLLLLYEVFKEQKDSFLKFNLQIFSLIDFLLAHKTCEVYFGKASTQQKRNMRKS